LVCAAKAFAVDFAVFAEAAGVETARTGAFPAAVAGTLFGAFTAAGGAEDATGTATLFDVGAADACGVEETALGVFAAAEAVGSDAEAF
jgi:hypothetical protein